VRVLDLCAEQHHDTLTPQECLILKIKVSKQQKHHVPFFCLPKSNLKFSMSGLLGSLKVAAKYEVAIAAVWTAGRASFKALVLESE
jgi:hypothetical protein